MDRGDVNKTNLWAADRSDRSNTGLNSVELQNVTQYRGSQFNVAVEATEDCSNRVLLKENYKEPFAVAAESTKLSGAKRQLYQHVSS